MNSSGNATKAHWFSGPACKAQSEHPSQYVAVVHGSDAREQTKWLKQDAKDESAYSVLISFTNTKPISMKTVISFLYKEGDSRLNAEAKRLASMFKLKFC